MIRNSQGKPLRKTALKKKRSTPRRTTVFRSRKYLDWLKERNCARCGILPHQSIIDPAHGPSAAVRVKGPDSGAIPLCRHCHVEQHQLGWGDFGALYNLDREAVAASHFALWQQENPSE